MKTTIAARWRYILAVLFIPAIALAGFGVKKGVAILTGVATITHPTSTCINAAGGADELCVTAGVVTINGSAALTTGRSNHVTGSVLGTTGGVFSSPANGFSGWQLDPAASDCVFTFFPLPVTIDPASTSMVLGLPYYVDTVGTGTDVVFDVMVSILTDSAPAPQSFRNGALAVDIPATLAVGDIALTGVPVTGLPAPVGGQRLGVYVCRLGANAGDTYVGTITLAPPYLVATENTL